MATAIPAAVAISASEMAGATTESDALDCEPNFEKVSSIPITVPKRPIKGDVEAIIESHVKPFVETLIASDDAASSIALFGVLTRDR